MKLNISDLLFTYVFGKTSKFNEMKLQQDDYCLCVEIPFKSKLLLESLIIVKLMPRLYTNVDKERKSLIMSKSRFIFLLKLDIYISNKNFIYIIYNDYSYAQI